MATVTIASSTAERILPYTPPLIERKAKWEDDWAADPELELVMCNALVGGSIPMCTLQRRYGNVKFPHESDFSIKPPVDYGRHFIRISYVGGAGAAADDAGGDAAAPIILFLGQIDQKTADLMGGSSDTIVGGAGTGQGYASGSQGWTATGGTRILEKIQISSSLFYDYSDPVEIGGASPVAWLPDMNSRDGHGLLVGNRSADTGGDNDTYLYDGGPDAEVWTHKQYLVYLVSNFVNQGSGTGDRTRPFWTVGGQLDVLDGMKTTIKFPEVCSVLEMLRQLIPIKYGLDFLVQPTEEGFSIQVFALSSIDTPVAGVTMPSNPHKTEVIKDGQLDFVEATIVESDARRVDTVQMIGKRIVVCGSLRAADGGLVGKWTQAMEDAYIDSGDDKVRKYNQFEDVYQSYGAPVDWDKTGWRVDCDFAGNPMGPPDLAAPNGTASGFQSAVRQTLTWLPLRKGVDYTLATPDDGNPDGHESDLMAPIAFVVDMLPPNGGIKPMVQCHDHNMHLSVPRFDWGIHLHPSANHELAWGIWTDDQLFTTSDQPRFDPDTLVATIAMESDARLRIRYDVPAELAAGDGSVMTVLDDEAQMWVVLAGTQVGIGEDTVSPTTVPKFLVLRNDKDRLALGLAGLMSRYVNERVKAKFVFKGHLPSANLLGSILTAYQQGDFVTRIGAPITSIEWKVGSSPETIISTGYS